MKPTQSVADVLSTLETQLAFHQRQEEIHASREAFHREQRGFHAAEREQIGRNLEALRAALAVAERVAAQPPRDDGQDLGSAANPRLGRMATQVIATLAPGERFGPLAIAREVNRRFGHRLRRPVDERQMSVVLRRLHRRGRIHRVRPGRPHWEALYTREAPASASG